MVLNQSLPRPARTRLDPSRIAGIAATLAVHVLAFLLLLLPLASTRVVPTPDAKKPWYRVEVIRNPPAPLPIEPVQVARHVQTPRTTQVPLSIPTATTPTPAVDSAVVMEAGTVQASTEGTPGPTTTVESGPPSAPVHLQYASAPAPAYPRDALVGGIEGTVMLRVLVDASGMPVEVTVDRSSGSSVLDRAARMQVLKKWRFVPAVQHGVAVPAYGLVPINFAVTR